MGALFFVLLLATPHGGPLLAQAGGPEALVLRVPLRGTPEAPQVGTMASSVVVEVPEGRVDRGSTALSDPEVAEISTLTSHSRHRAVITLHLRPGVTLAPERIEAMVEKGQLTLRVHRPRTAAPAPAAEKIAAAPAPEKTAPVLAAPAAPLGMKESTPAPLALWWRALAALLLLGGGGWLLVYRLRRQRATELCPTAIDILATRALGRSQRLLVIGVAEQRFLVAASEPGGVRLLSRIGAGKAAPALERAIAEGPAAAAGENDPLGEVFEDMLKEIETGVKEQPAPPPREAPKKARPALHLIEVQDAKAPAAPAPSLGKQQEFVAPAAAKRPAPSDFASGNTDAAGILALRRYRQGAGR